LRVDVRTGARPGEPRPAVLICHGFKGFKDWGFFPKLAERLAGAGFTAVSFNLSGSGVGDGEEFDELDRFGHMTPSGDLADLAAVTAWVQQEFAPPWMGMVGHSRGGGLSVLHSAREPRIRALVTWAAIDSFLRWTPELLVQWRRERRLDVVNTRTGQVLTLFDDALADWDANREALDIVAAARRVHVPWLLVHGTADTTVPVDAAYALAEETGSDTTELLLLDGADHTFGVRHPWQGSTLEFDEVLERTVGHLVHALG
jgi:dienelactone hydrolase